MVRRVIDEKDRLLEAALIYRAATETLHRLRSDEKELAARAEKLRLCIIAAMQLVEQTQMQLIETAAICDKKEE